MTPSPKAGCSTSSPMRSPRSWASLGTGAVGRPARERGLDHPLAVLVGEPAVVLVVVAASRRRYGRRVAVVATRAQALAAVRAAPADVALRLDQLARDLVEEP